MADMFDPHELEEMAERLARVERHEQEGYEMTFFINQNDALELLDTWHQARLGEPMAMAKCWTEFGKIMMRLEASVDDDITDY
jgi:hypothetical protein